MTADSKLELARESFKTVMEADIHEDNKASRTLSAMAFLTAAAAAIFAKVFSPNIAAGDTLQKFSQILSSYTAQPTLPIANQLIVSIGKPIISLFGIDWTLLTFFTFLILMVLGVLLYLAALGPSLNIPASFRNRQEKAKSLIFFGFIGEMTSDSWEKHWKNSTSADLESQMLTNLVIETHLVAQKTKTKVLFMSIGSFVLKIAILFLCFLTASFFSYDINLVRLFVFGAGVLFIVLLGFEILARPSRVNWKLLSLIPMFLLILVVTFLLA